MSDWCLLSALALFAVGGGLVGCGLAASSSRKQPKVQV